MATARAEGRTSLYTLTMDEPAEAFGRSASLTLMPNSTQLFRSQVVFSPSCHRICRQSAFSLPNNSGHSQSLDKATELPRIFLVRLGSFVVLTFQRVREARFFSSSQYHATESLGSRPSEHGKLNQCSTSFRPNWIDGRRGRAAQTNLNMSLDVLYHPVRHVRQRNGTERSALSSK